MAITMANGSFPISDEHSAHSAWLLRGHSKEYTPEQVQAHIRRACKKLKIAPPGGAVSKSLDDYVTIAKDATGAKFAHDMAVGNSASVGKPPKNIKAGEASNKRRRIVIHKPQNFS